APCARSARSRPPSLPARAAEFAPPGSGCESRCDRARRRPRACTTSRADRSRRDCVRAWVTLYGSARQELRSLTLPARLDCLIGRVGATLTTGAKNSCFFTGFPQVRADGLFPILEFLVGLRR